MTSYTLGFLGPKRVPYFSQSSCAMGLSGGIMALDRHGPHSHHGDDVRHLMNEPMFNPPIIGDKTPRKTQSLDMIF